jgi:hypothetical protein
MKLLAALTFLLVADDVREELLGRWVGESRCTAVRKKCRDEVASYRISRSEAGGEIVTVSLNKMVGEEESVMSVLDFTVDAQKRTLRAEYKRDASLHLLWEFAWEGKRMKGTLTELPGGDVIRHIVVTKE